MRPKRMLEGRGDAAAEAAPLGFGSHSATFQSPSALRTRLRLGLTSEMVPSCKWPRKRLSQRNRTVSDSARRKYSYPKRGSSLNVTDCASTVGPPQSEKL